MANTDDPDMQYVTRKELREELAPIHAVLRLIVERMATKEDLLRFATKEDLLRFATKEDLLRFATKEDLLRFATKEDLLRFATKEDVAAVVAASERRISDGVATSIAEAERRISDDVARHTQASAEETRAQIRALDDKYNDVHPRLDALEATRPRPAPRARKRALRRKPRRRTA